MGNMLSNQNLIGSMKKKPTWKGIKKWGKEM